MKKNYIKEIILSLALVFFTACGSSNTGDTTVDTAIDKIANYAQNGGAAPTLQDYLDAGVTGITNVDEINAYVSGLTKEDVDTKEEIQAIANELGVEITGNVPPIAKAGSPLTTVEAGETVYFSSRHSTDPDGEIVKYQWFENGVSIAKVPSLWKVYNVAGTYNIKLVVTDNDGATSSDEYTVTVTAPPPPPKPKAKAEAEAEGYDTFFENNTSTHLPAPGTTTINIDAADAVPSITKITVTIDSTGHGAGLEWVTDLTIYLTSPTGTVVLLAASNGGSGPYYTNTTFDDDAATSISVGTAPFTGTFSPEEALTGFVGENATGTWILSIFDSVGFDGSVGTLNSWSITVQ